MLDVNIASKSFRAADGSTLLAIKDLNFKLDPESFTCIVGPSGCGKTTTLRMILGLEGDYDGSITQASSTTSGRVAAVFQEPRLLPWRRVEHNIRLAMPEHLRDQSLDALFDELGLTDVKNFYPAELSLGLARRVALARAYALEPSLLILDEPFVSLDEATAVRLRALLMQLCNSRPTTTLMVTHNVAEAVALADRIIVLSERPARVLENFVLESPREQRDESVIASTVKYINSVATTEIENQS